MTQARVFREKLPLIRNCPALNELRLAEDLTDVTIKVQGGAQLRAHKVILAARIPALRASANGVLRKDTTVLRWPTVHLTQATSLIQYAYTGEVEITQDNALGIVGLARMVQLPVLENWAITVLANSVSNENLEVTWHLARYTESKLLTDACLRRMAAHFESFVYSDLFSSLPAATILSLLRSDQLAVSSEEELFGAISRWASGCNELREAKMNVHLTSMLKEIQWDQTTVQFRERLLEFHRIFQESTACLRLLARITNWISGAEKVQSPCPFNRRIRPPQALIIFGIGKPRNRCSVLQFDPQLKNERRIADMQTRNWATYSVVGGSIFVVGGDTTLAQVVPPVEEFLLRERRWRPRAALALGRLLHAAAVVRVNATTTDEGGLESGEKALIGVFGGSYFEAGTETHLASSELFDISRDRWHSLPDLPQRRSRLAAVCMHGDSRIFVFGGLDGSSCLDSVVFCQLRADWKEKATTASSAAFWFPAASMRNARYALAAVSFRGTIMVAGGINERNEISNVVEVFSPPHANCPLGQWTEVAGMMQPRSYFHLLTCGDAVLALGNTDDPQNTVETFTSPDGSADMCNDFTDWTWSLKSPVISLADISGAASVRL